MKKILTTLVIGLLFFSIHGQTNLYVNPEFERLALEHETIAIVPFDTQILLRPKQMKELNSEQLDEMEKAEGKAIQSAMYSWFLIRKKRGKLQNIELLEPRNVNAILKKNDIDYDNINEYTPEELAYLLNVDAVIMGEFQTNKPMSEGASVVTTILFGFGTTNSATINMSIYNGIDGLLLWNYNKKVRGGLGSDSNDLINILMRKASRRMAYTKNDTTTSL